MSNPIGRNEKAKKVVELIGEERSCRWVGVYDVGPKMVSIVVYRGPSPPLIAVSTHQRAHGRGGSGKEGRGRRRRAHHPRYLTVFGSTLSEIIIPVQDGKTGAVVGTIDVESEQARAFSLADERECLNEVAARRSSRLLRRLRSWHKASNRSAYA